MTRRLLEYAFWAWCILLSGCTVYQNARRTMIHEPAEYSWKHDRRRSVEAYRALAEQVWRQESLYCQDLAASSDYALGFRDGFVDFVYAGGTGEPPPIPPRHFWNVAIRVPDGKLRVEQWFAGYRHGAGVARDGGYREFGTIDSSLFGIAVDPVAGHSLDMIGPMYGEPDAAWADDDFAPHGEVLPEPHEAPSAPPLEPTREAPVEPADPPDDNSSVDAFHDSMEEPVPSLARDGSAHRMATPGDEAPPDTSTVGVLEGGDAMDWILDRESPDELREDERGGSEPSGAGDTPQAVFAESARQLPAPEPLRAIPKTQMAPPLAPRRSTGEGDLGQTLKFAPPATSAPMIAAARPVNDATSTLRIVDAQRRTEFGDRFPTGEPSTLVQTSFVVTAPRSADMSQQKNSESTPDARSHQATETESSASKSTIRVREISANSNQRRARIPVTRRPSFVR